MRDAKLKNHQRLGFRLDLIGRNPEGVPRKQNSSRFHSEEWDFC